MAGTTVRRLFALLVLLPAPIRALASTSTEVSGEIAPVVASPLGIAPTCPCTAGTPENEVSCGLPTDTTNGGCGIEPNLFSSIACGETVCGTVGSTQTFGDTDWYELVLAQPSRVIVTITAQFVGRAGILDDGAGNPPSCPPGTDWLFQPDSCVATSDTRELAAGTWWIIALPLATGVACGTPYTLTVECPIHENDFETYPPPWSAIAPAICTNYCDSADSPDNCYCDQNCYEIGDCCLDACATCGECAHNAPHDTESCEGYCGTTPNRGSCWCDTSCVVFDNCCFDACSECGECL